MSNTIEDYRIECQRLETLLLKVIEERKQAELLVKQKETIIEELKDKNTDFVKQVAEMIQTNSNAQGRLLNYINEKFTL